MHMQTTASPLLPLSVDRQFPFQSQNYISASTRSYQIGIVHVNLRQSRRTSADSLIAQSLV